MDLRRSRFRDQIGSHCPAPACQTPVIRCSTGRIDLLIHPEPEQAGTYKIVDTGNQIPFARKLLSAQMFGLQGTLHVRHEDGCAHYKRWKRQHG